jgi:hypothetical protein
LLQNWDNGRRETSGRHAGQTDISRGETAMGMNPVDLGAVEDMAATATEGDGQGSQGLQDFQQSFHAVSGGRTASFGQGAIEGRAYQAIEGAL